MKKLKLTTKPKRLTLREMWELYLSGEEGTPEFIVKTLDLAYPNYNREDVDVETRIELYRSGIVGWMQYAEFIKGMETNGSK